jgi:hypothetical protein
MDIKEYKKFIQTKCTTAWTDHCIFAAELVKLLEPDIVVDLGVDEGYSTFSFAAYNVGKVYGVDIFQSDSRNNYKETINKVIKSQFEISEKYNVNNIQFVPSSFTDLCKVWNKEIDILHIDGLHTAESVKEDFENWSKFCHSNSVILFHDVLYYYETVGKLFLELDGYKILREQSAGLGILTVNEGLHNFIENLSNEITG